MSKKFIVETSARHIHLSQADLETLFGKGHELTCKKELSQPGQYACEEKVEVVGTKGSLKMSVLGPTRNATQVELSLTDARSIGVVAPIRESGDIAGTGSCKLVGPCGSVELKEGVIAAKRHIHVTPEAAVELGVKDNDVVYVKVDSAALEEGYSLQGNGDLLVKGDKTTLTITGITTGTYNIASGYAKNELEKIAIDNESSLLKAEYAFDP